MKRFILKDEPGKNGMVRLEGDDYRYLVRVRRLAPGEFFPALLPGGREVLVQVQSVDGGVLLGGLMPENGGQAPDLAACRLRRHLPPLILFQALPKGEKMDLIVRQAAESGLAEIVPFASEFSVTKLKAERGGAVPGRQGGKVSRWERIIKEARQQSGSKIPTAVRQPLSLDGLFAYWEEIKNQRPGALGLLFHHAPLEQASLHGYLNNKPEAVAIGIGPEGGFSPAEAARFLAAGFKPLTIGDTILRTETAALYAAAAVQIILLERNSWETKQAESENG